MHQYILRRLVLFIPTLIGASVIIFVMVRIMPGDVAFLIISGQGGEGGAVNEEELSRLRAELGIDRPYHVQYFDWVKGMVTLKMGESLWTGQPIVEEIGRRFPVTIQLAVLSVIVSTIIGIPIGILGAIYQDKWIDHVSRLLTIAGLAIPNFWYATLIVLVTAVYFSWVPPLGEVPRLWADPVTGAQQLVLPAIALGYRFSSVLARLVRSTMLEVLRQDYLRTARAKGLAETTIIYRHALKNAALPIITMLGIETGVLLSGSIIVEYIFVLPGIGGALVDSVIQRDWPLTQSIIVLMVGLYLTVNLVVDLAYGWLDPRIRYQ